MKITAEELALDFDGGFARAHAEPAPQVDLLALAIGGDRFALRLAGVAGMFTDRALTKVPSRRTDLLGLTAFRGSVVPVFDLARRLGYPPAAEARWLVLAKATNVALAFERFEGHVRVPATAVGDVVVLDGQPVSMIDIGAIAEAIAEEAT